MASARPLLVICLGIALFVAGGATGTALAAADAREGPLFSSPAEIREVQRILEKEKYLKPGDRKKGELDDATASALRAFQADHFTRASGRVDTDTMGLLVSHGMPTPFGRMAKAHAAGARPAASEERVALTAATSPATGAEAQGATGAVSERSMPRTGRLTILVAVIGAVLLGGGLVILFLRRV
ncbi:MAG: peptidoglycan-binding protein [Acidobacteria bacterium]|nr:peptidoglycan-binding protein [Acidobacteriota bacterium]